MKTRAPAFALLLALAAVAGWHLLKPRPSDLPGTSDVPLIALAGEIKSTAVEKTGDHAHLILTATFTQSGSDPVRLDPPLVQLLATGGQTVPRYLGPMLADAVLSGPGPAEVTLHYWLPLADLSSPLTLVASGTRHPVNLP